MVGGLMDSADSNPAADNANIDPTNAIPEDFMRDLSPCCLVIIVRCLVIILRSGGLHATRTPLPGFIRTAAKAIAGNSR
jgi:hypothetical protein